MAVEVVSDGLLQLVVRRGFLEALAQIMLQVLVQLASCQCETRGEKKKNSTVIQIQNGTSSNLPPIGK